MLKLVLNQASCKEPSLEALIKHLKGFRSLELDTFEINSTNKNGVSLKTINELMHSFDLEVESVYGLEDFSLSSERFFKTKILPIFNQMMSQAYKLDAELLIVSPSLLDQEATQAGVPQWRILNRTKNRLKVLLKKAFENGLTVGLEFSSDQKSSFSNLKDLKELFETLEDKDNLGVVMNVFDLAQIGLDYAQLKELSEKLYLFRLSDSKLETLTNGNLFDRTNILVPGEGTFDYKEFFRNTRKLGYRRPFSVVSSELDCSRELYQKVFDYLYPLFRASEDPT
ncbi:MAG: sugar phosphate isomerase/epimerase [Candidatus Lokiarchaeota archaeon]|nr:sugar phosphate isomerase/epimerase [Candidatus Lokiarchaeota archaeon]